jgi:hypothetical protein
MVWGFKTRSTLETIRRIIQARKFLALLPQKLAQAETKWHAAQPEQPPEFEFIEEEPDGSEAQRLLGGPIQKRFRFFKDDNRKV